MKWLILSWNVTRKCNLFCKHCYRSSGPEIDPVNELDTQEGKLLINQIKRAGFKIIILSGGEPLLREDIFELASFASHNGLKPALGSNGMLITPDKAENLKLSGISTVSISLDSVNSKFHDDFRNFNGAWKGAVKGIKNSIKSGLRVQINTTLTENNFDQFENIVDFASNLGVKAVHPFFLVPTGRGIDIESDTLKKEKYFQMIEKVMEMQKHSDLELKPTCAPQFLPIARDMGIPMRYGRGCIAGINYCCILPEGDVHVCPYLPVNAGDVRKTSFNKIWEESEVFQKLRDMDNYEGHCGKCQNLDSCGGCRARAYYYYENYMAEDPWCKLWGE
jgi:AdoMet-dependent heme synthase